jgi:DNA-binding response OmpR family regulator
MTSAGAASGRILIVEDDRVVAETLTLYLEHAGYAAETRPDGLSGLSRALEPDVALVVLDWMIPGLNGYELCRRLRAASHVPILMLTARTAEDDRVRVLDAGADDYVAKPFSPREVVARVQALLRRAGPPAPPGAQGPGPAPLRVGDLEVDAWRREARVRGQAVALTPTEFKLLEVLARHPGRAFTREELLARAFGPDYDGLDRTVDVHITNLRRKLELQRASRYVCTVHGVGYRLAAPEERER